MTRPILTLTILLAPLAHAGIIEQLTIGAWGDHLAHINVDEVGAVSCAGFFDGDCDGLILPSTITPHGTLSVSGTLGQWTLAVTAYGKASPAFDDVDYAQINNVRVSSTRGGVFFSSFTDTNVGLAHMFSFDMMASNPGGTEFSGMTDGLSRLPPWGTMIGSATGESYLDFVNPTDASSGSLTSIIGLTFNGGSMNAQLIISPPSSPVPEPGTFALLAVGLAAILTGCARSQRSGRSYVALGRQR